MLSEPLLVGRDEELGRLAEFSQQTISGKGGLVLLAGEAGIGKTRLANEFEKKAKEAGFKVLVGNCLPSAQIPYLVFLEALNHLFEEKEKTSRSQKLSKAAKKAAPDLMKAIPVVGGTLKASAALFQQYRSDGRRQEVSKEHVLFKALDILKEESSKTPLVLHLDDLQWADSMSIAMLHFLARNCRDLPVMLLGTYRTEEVLNQEAGIHPLLDAIRVMKRENIVQELNLRPLVEKELNRAVSSMLEMPLQETVLERIFKDSGGSPLFAVETIRLLVNSNAMVMEDGAINIKGKMEDLFPTSVLEVITRRIERVSNKERKVLDFASVIGPAFDPGLLADASRMDHMEVLEVLEGLGMRHQLAVERETGFAFTHEKIARVLYDAISRSRRKELHLRVGRSLEKNLPNDSLFSILSYHFDKAQERDKCVKYSLLAGKYCFANKAMREAKSNFLLVLAKTESDPCLAAERLDALEGLGDLGLHLSSPVEWYSYYERYLNLNHDKKARARVLAKAAECWDQSGLVDTKKANALLDEAELLSEGDSRNLAVIEVNRGMLLINDGKNDEALAHLGKAKDYFEKVGDSNGSIRCRNLMVISLVCDYRFTEAVAILEELLPMTIKSGDPELIIEVELSCAELYGYVGQTELSKKYSSKVIQESEKMGMTLNWRDGLFFRAVELELEGDIEAARTTRLKALENAKISKVSHQIIRDEIGLGRCEVVLGLVESAEYHYEDAARRMPTLDPNSRTRALSSFYLSMLKAELLVAKGKIQQSDEVFAKAIGECEAMHYWYAMVDCRSRYGISLARRGLKDKAQVQFDEAMKMAQRIGCEKRVQLWAKRVGIVLDVNGLNCS